MTENNLVILEADRTIAVFIKRAQNKAKVMAWHNSCKFQLCANKLNLLILQW